MSHHPIGSPAEDPDGGAASDTRGVRAASSAATVPAWYSGSSPPAARSGRHDLDALLAWLLTQPTAAPSEGSQLEHHVDAMTWLAGAPSTSLARILLARGEWLIFKATTAPGVGEAALLDTLAGAGLPVPEVAAIGYAGPRDGMLTWDLGPATRTATIPEQARALAAVHRVRPAGHLPRVDAFHLADTPGRALWLLQGLSAIDGFADSTVLRAGLRLLSLIGDVRAAGAYTPPYGLCHRNTGALLATDRGVHIVGWRHACIGPGLLDLAALIAAPDSEADLDLDRDEQAFAALADAYRDAGGDHGVQKSRGGVPAHRWALGWHAALRVESVLFDAATRRTHLHHVDPASLHRQATHWLALALHNLS